MSNNSANKVLKNINGEICIDNINPGLLSKVVENMQKKDSGFCVCRQFVYDKSYTMLLVNVCDDIETSKIIVTVALWPDESDADYYITRQIPFYVKEGNVHVWENFCEAVSGSKAIWKNDLLGNFFIGRIVKKKVYFDGKPTYFENVVVEKFIDRLDTLKTASIVNSKIKPKEKKRNNTQVTKKIFSDDEDE